MEYPEHLFLQKGNWGNDEGVGSMNSHDGVTMPRSAPILQEGGSLLLLSLFLCLGAAVLLATFASVLLLGRTALDEERRGKARLSLMEGELGRLAALAPDLRDRIPEDGTSLQVDLSRKEVLVTGFLRLPAGRIAGEADSSPVEAEVRLGASGEEGVLGAWIESAKDGVDLPRAPVVAGSVTSSGSTEQARIMSVMEPPAEQPSVAAATGAPPAQGVLGEGIIWEQLPRPWGLDEVTRGWLQGESWLNGRCRPAERTVILAGSPGQYVQPLPQAISNDPSSPALVMATGGVTLDVQGRGDIYGVLVSDGGSIALDGTRLHGAAFATRDLRLGTSGSVRWDPQALRYATDRSLVKLRLMPGSRYEYPRG